MVAGSHTGTNWQARAGTARVSHTEQISPPVWSPATTTTSTERERGRPPLSLAVTLGLVVVGGTLTVPVGLLRTEEGVGRSHSQSVSSAGRNNITVLNGVQWRHHSHVPLLAPPPTTLLHWSPLLSGQPGQQNINKSNDFQL